MTEVQERRLPVVKAQIIRVDELTESNIMETAPKGVSAFQNTNAISPPYDPLDLCSFFDISGPLRTNIDAYASNIDSNGHTFEPVIDLEDESAPEVLRQAMLEERLHDLVQTRGAERVARGLSALAQGVDSPDFGDALTIPDEEVAARLEELRAIMAAERMSLEFFFDNCTAEGSFLQLRRTTRQDYEILGNAYWEVLRDDAGMPTQFNRLPGAQVRLTPRLPPVVVERPAARSLLRQETLKQSRGFRFFVQVANGLLRTKGKVQSGRNVVYFKEFGDPRVVSSVTGEIYKTIEELEEKEQEAKPATEVLHWRLHSPSGPYGVPRWVCEMVNLLGSRHAEQVNMFYFENKSIPPLAILVSGGTLAKDSATEVRNFINNEIRGSKNFHKIMILEASSESLDGGGGAAVRVEIKPLTDALQKEAMFLEYLARNRDALGMVFRNPKIVRGDTSDINRATAEAAIMLAEQQVFGPERKEFDWTINREILSALGIRFWRFVSRGPEMTDPSELVEMLKSAADSGYLSIAEMRRIAERAFGVTLPIFDHWTNFVPLAVVQAHQTSLKTGGVAGLEQQFAPGTRPEPAAEEIMREVRKAVARKALEECVEG